MGCTDQKVRIINKKGSGVATVPTSADHRDGSWIATDIYDGEWYLDTDTGYAYTRNGAAIIPLYVGIAPAGTIGTVNTSPHAAGPYETILVNSTVTNIKIDLPAAATSTTKFVVKKISALNTVLIDPNGAETIEGLTDYTLYLLSETVTIQSDGTAWYILDTDIPYYEDEVLSTVSSPNFNTGAPTNIPDMTWTVPYSGDWNLKAAVNINSDNNEEFDLTYAINGTTETDRVVTLRMQQNNDESIQADWLLSGLTAGQVVTLQGTTRNDNMDLENRWMRAEWKRKS